MFKKIMTGCLVALAVTMSACQYGLPQFGAVYRPIVEGIHILKVNDKSVTATSSAAPVMEYELTTHTSADQGADFDGKYRFHKFLGPIFEIWYNPAYGNMVADYYITPVGSYRPNQYFRGARTVVLKHETKNYYWIGQDITTDESGEDWSKIVIWGWNIRNDDVVPEPETGPETYIVQYPFESTGSNYSETGTWYYTDVVELGIKNAPFLELPYIVSSPVSTPITVFADFTPFADTPPAELPDYLALQYKKNEIDEWITIKEINNPKWSTILSSELPVFGRNITIPDLNDATTIYLRVYAAVGFIETTVGVSVSLTISTNRRPTW